MKRAARGSWYALVSASLRYKLLVLIGFAVVVGFGVRAFQQVPVDAFLDVTPVQVKRVLAGVPGVADLSLEANKGKPQLTIRADREAMARYGVNASELLDVDTPASAAKPPASWSTGRTVLTSRCGWRPTTAATSPRSRRSRSVPRAAPSCRSAPRQTRPR
jgi:hypothetical protein